MSFPGAVGALPVAGAANIVDGDTFDIGATRIRLWGVDAVEGAQTCELNGHPWDCGGEATRRLTAFLAGTEVKCEPKDRDRYGRTVATCSARGADIGAWLVSEGLALDYVEFSKGTYKGQQVAAETAKRGVWRSKFIPPWEFRHGESKADSTEQRR